MRCLIQEAVYWYNITPRDDVSPSTAPANRIYEYEVRVKGAYHSTASPGPKHSSYQVRECVWIKAPQSRYTTKFGRGEMTKIISPQPILVGRYRTTYRICTLATVSSHWRKSPTAQRSLREGQRVCCRSVEKILS